MRAAPFFLSLLMLGAPAQAADTGGYGYPETATVPVVETQFGVPVADPYRWLENDVRTDPKVRQWVERENAATNAYLKTLPGRDVLKARMRALTDFERFGVPRKAGSRYFYMRNDGLQNQSVLWVREGLAGPARVLIDPNGWAKDGATALGEWTASDDGAMLAYAIQDGGTDWRTVKLLDVANGRTLDDEVKWVKFSPLSWAADGSGFYYSRFAAPEPGQTYQSTNLNQKVYFHRIGTPQAEDRLIYATPDRPRLGHRAQVTDDGRWLLITSSEGTDSRYELHVLDLTRPNAKPATLVKGLDYNWAMIGNVGPSFYFVTNQGAQRQRIVTLDAASPRRKPVAIVPERPETLVGASIVGAKIVLSYLGDAKSDAEMVHLDGRPAGDVRLPGIGTAAGFGGKVGDPETFYSFSSYTTPPTIYRFDTATGIAEVFARPKTAFDPDRFETVQHFYSSKDGTRIPVFVIRRKGAMPAGGAPTVLYGYGGFNASQTPGFSATRLAWIEQGGVFAIANLRGGGEYGKAWHDAGRLQNKQNVFDDFIAAGEYLIAQGITAPGKLAAEGRSNGGLLVGAVVNQRPDLFAAALPAVGVMDMLRFDRFTAGRYWVDDYGDPGKEEDFRTLYAYSPYHNIRGGVDYPAILVTTADTDDRVVPGHSFKYAAKLQASNIGAKPHLIRIETRAGHGSGKPTDKLIEESADMYAFVARWTGLTIGAPDGD
ncbi:prolyl oligopeptidase family serine peptidase [Sphingomonas colocasiae]|uniref:prolyl oligopeptidase n=1 Tax=Sphingomonas colocasiae TaxID=1848973 RepID=A0ABS7PLW2_9SPHN|nr:prolyl oligopeptidase family serine peptidase [Sphingomonas colocasiae]